MVPSQLNGKHILVVDDELQLREALIFDLTRRSCHVYQAGNGSEALEIVKNHPIDIVISDVRMPNGDGVFLLKEIRKMNTKTPIVMLATGFADLSAEEAIHLGAYGLVEKPIDRKKLFQLLEDSVKK